MVLSYMFEASLKNKNQILNASSAVKKKPSNQKVLLFIILKAAHVGQHQLPKLARRIPSAPVLTSA